jgi:hypothetical protein
MFPKLEAFRGTQPGIGSLRVCHILERDATLSQDCGYVLGTDERGISIVYVIISVALNEYKLSTWAVMREFSKRYERATFILAIVSSGNELNLAGAWGPGPRRPVAVLLYLELSVCMVIYLLTIPSYPEHVIRARSLQRPMVAQDIL